MTFWKVLQKIPFLKKSFGTRYKSNDFQLDENVKKISFKAVLSDLERKIFFITQSW